MSEKMIKGYKGFSKGLVCRDKQYAENTVFNCESGMCFCENPLNVLKNYPLYASETKSFSEYAEVEAPEDVTESNGNKSVTKQLKIGNKISFDELIKAGVEFNLSKEKFDKEKSVATGKCSGASAVGGCSGASTVGFGAAEQWLLAMILKQCVKTIALLWLLVKILWLREILVVILF